MNSGLLRNRRWPVGDGVSMMLVCFAFVIGTASLGSAQTQSVATAAIPFAFWVDDQQLPAGQYMIDSPTSTVLVLHQVTGHAAQETFTVPVDHALPNTESELVFIIQDGKYVLAEIRESGQEQRLTALFGIALPTGGARRQVPITFTQR